MDTEILSLMASPDGQPIRQEGSVFDEYDEFSNLTAGTSSPLAHLATKSLRSDSKSRLSIDPMMSTYDNSTVQGSNLHPQQLALNNHNLHGFTRRVETGGVPLRLDVIPDDAYVDYGKTTLGAKFDKKEAEERGDVSLLTMAPRTRDPGEFGSEVADSAAQCSNASLHCPEASMDGNTWNIERASVDPQVGSPTRHYTDPLNLANLNQHLQELSCGPVPLKVENIVAPAVPCVPRDVNVSTTVVLRDTRVSSLMVESSDADLMSTSEVISLNRNRSAKHTSVGEAMDDMWSTTSTWGFDTMHFGSRRSTDEKLHPLSKENLRQLRHQLESGETPLRPEMLAGVGTMMQAMAQTKSNISASTAVEPTMTEERSKLVDSAACQGSSLHSFQEGRAPFLRTPANAEKEIDANAMSAGSSQTTRDNMQTTEVCDPRAIKSSKYNTSELPRTLRIGVDEPEVSEARAVDEVDPENEEEEEDPLREKTSASGDSREDQNESVFNMTEDDGVDDMADPASMSRHMRELFKLVQESRQDQSQLRQLVLGQRSVIQRLQNMVEGLESELSTLKKQ
ncbi:hypothetical protein JKF63_01759 [Porcisia hertigi]|uniref:Uncharacterized protein n=1 Tax=Porcisia hertigi TaxID=2761500 RepID=A0A836L1M9_9TRYP|nr:hypothetical protein JKF63_01759 [Porcisia hertigi]